MFVKSLSPSVTYKWCIRLCGCDTMNLLVFIFRWFERKSEKRPLGTQHSQSDIASGSFTFIISSTSRRDCGLNQLYIYSLFWFRKILFGRLRFDFFLSTKCASVICCCPDQHLKSKTQRQSHSHIVKPLFLWFLMFCEGIGVTLLKVATCWLQHGEWFSCKNSNTIKSHVPC